MLVCVVPSLETLEPFFKYLFSLPVLCKHIQISCGVGDIFVIIFVSELMIWLN